MTVPPSPAGQRREAARLIRKNRMRKGLSQEECARAVGVSRQMWMNYEQAKSLPRGGNAERVSQLLEIPPAKLTVKPAGPSRSTLALAELIEQMVDERVAQIAKAAA